MASRSLGTLTLDLVAKIGGYEQGLQRAEKEAQKRAAAIERAFDNTFAVITAGFASLAAAGTAALAAINAQADRIASFQDLADKIGDSAEQIATLQQAANLSGVAIDTVAAASVKLTAALSKTDDEGKAVGQALKDIGLGFDEFKRLSPVEQIDAVAKALDGFQDGAGKTAIAVSLFGKSGAEILPFLKDLAEQGTRQIGLTKEQIAAADEYTKATARLRGEFELFIQQQTASYIPVLSQIQSVLAEVAKNEDVVTLATNAVKVAVDAAVVVLQTLLVVGSDIVFVFKGVGREIGAVAAQAAALARLDFTGFKAISEAVKEDGVRARKELDAFQARVMKIGQTPYMDDEIRRLQARSVSGQPVKPILRATPVATGGGGKGAADDPTKKLLDNQLKELDRYINSEKELMAERNKFLDLYNQQGLISIKDYYAQQQNIRDEATQNQIKAYDAQIEALRKYQASATKETDKAEAQGKINDLLDKQAKLQRDAGNAALEAGIKQQQAAKAYQDSLGEINAKILELNGNLGGAALIRFDKQYEQIKKLAEVSGDFASVEQIGRLREYEKAQADINAAQQKFSLIQGDLQIAEERITIARERGTIGEIDALVKSGQERRKAVALLDEQLQKLLAINDALRTPEQTQAIERLKLQLESLKATIDPLADRFNTIFSDALGDAFADFVTGTKTAKEAFKDFANTVIKEITRMVAKNVASQLASGLFGGSSGDSGGGFNFGSLLSSLFGGGKATGGPVQPNKLYRVNENGPELFEAANGSQFLMTGTESGKIIPNGAIRASGGQVVNVNIQGYVQRQTPSQIAMEVRRQSNISASRLGPR